MVVVSKSRGISLMSALLLITIVMIIATTMAGVFTMNINITNRVSNASIALSEAEAGIAEVLYQMTHKDNIEGDGNQKNPKIEWGLNGETIRATTTPGMQPDEAYHVVTFDTGSSFPYSTNNTTLTNDSGYDGRVVPDGMFHVISTGYCKGQYRTVECVIEKPPFPFGLATSGAIVSADPIRVVGTSTQAGYDSGETDRPGHILCNSPEGVVIGGDDNPDNTTNITGFVKSVGPIAIAEPAVVRGGIRSGADATTLTDIEIQDFNLDAEGADGVITLLDSDYYEDQELDVMYKYLSGGTLHYHGDVNLQRAMIWVNGNLTVDGAVTGEGLIVVTGKVEINDGALLNGTDKMALIAGGDVDIGKDTGSPEANFFSGLVYTEGNLDARNITIVGNAVVNSPDPAKGRADLENVTFVSNEETGDMTVEITSVSGAQDSYNAPNIQNSSPNFNFGGNGLDENDDGVTDEYFIGADDADDKLDWIFDNQFRNSIFGPTGELGDLAGDPFVIPAAGFDPYGFNARFASMVGAIQAAQTEILTNDADIAAKETQISNLTPGDDDDDNDQSQIDQLQSEIDALTAANEELQADAELLYETEARQLLQDVRDQARLNANASGTVKTESREGQEIITRNERFNLNEYLPQSDRVKMSFWKVYPRRL
jgi:hypothetical protein